MKFLRIELENLFAYRGVQGLDVGMTTPDRNIVLVWGRNGMGKTSLLRAIQLLFLGAEDTRSRTIGFPPRTLPHRQFVLGDGANWSGIINRRARKIDPEAQARVRIEWNRTGAVGRRNAVGTRPRPAIARR
jgi:DNA sulfur modification protein DndD